MLAVRDREALSASLLRAGFEVREVLGGWSGGTLTEQAREVIVIARRG